MLVAHISGIGSTDVVLYLPVPGESRVGEAWVTEVQHEWQRWTFTRGESER